MPPSPRDVPALLQALIAADPARPRLTWYGADGERVELSAKVLDNWVAKTANLLVHELDAGPGTRVGIALPPHWRALVWTLATWAAGCCAVVDGGGQHGRRAVDVLVTADPKGARAPAVVAVALPALARSFGADLPAEAIDAAVDVRLQPDVFVPAGSPAPGDGALDVGSEVLAHGDLLDAARAAATAAGLGRGARLLADAAAEHAVRHLLAPLLVGGSLVAHHDLGGLGPDERARLARAEAITVDSLSGDHAIPGDHARRA